MERTWGVINKRRIGVKRNSKYELEIFEMTVQYNHGETKIRL